ncbi:hypothetical protein SO802_017399 [Lithocarpus litseifolius]|uniref:G-patch domain-containing protein n=1 Tax=Lithocarpus litseifolius TaxID=425828 RepID=A0AAW2CJ22_9ROSI
MDFASYSNNNVVAMMRRMNYLPGMNLGKIVKKPTVQDPIIPTTTPPFGLGYKPSDDDLLEMESPYEARTSNEEGGEAPSEDHEGSSTRSDSSSDSSSDSGDRNDDSNSASESNNSEDYVSQYSGNDWGEPPSDREDEDVGLFYENRSDDDVDYYDGDIEDDAEAEPINMGSDVGSDQYRLVNVMEARGGEVEEAKNIDYDDHSYGRPSDWSYITNVSSRSDPQYDNHGREIPKLGSFHNLELGSLTLFTKEEDDIDARLATLDRKLMIHNFRNLTLESLKDGR